MYTTMYTIIHIYIYTHNIICVYPSLRGRGRSPFCFIVTMISLYHVI